MTESMRIPLLAIVGPTASGKSAVGMALARRLDGEIVSADSMQVYRGMDIGTAKPSLGEQAEIRHHLIDAADPDEVFNVARYQELAGAAIADAASRGKLPIMVGGTGLYVDAVVGDFSSRTRAATLRSGKGLSGRRRQARTARRRSTRGWHCATPRPPQGYTPTICGGSCAPLKCSR